MSDNVSAESANRAIGDAVQGNPAKKASIQTLRTKWGPDPKAWIPEGFHFQSPDPKQWSQDFLEKLAELSELSGVRGHSDAILLIRQSAQSRSHRLTTSLVGKQFPTSRDIRNALDEYRIIYGDNTEGVQPTRVNTISNLPTHGAASTGRKAAFVKQNVIHASTDNTSATKSHDQHTQGDQSNKTTAETACADPDRKSYYELAVTQAYDNGGERGAAFGHPEEGATIMTPAIARLGPSWSENSTGPFISTKQPMKSLFNAKKNEETILLLENHFHASMATILQDPELHASEALKLPVSMIAILWKIVEDHGITYLPAFHSMLNRKIRRLKERKKKPKLALSTLKELQAETMEDMDDINNQLDEAERDDKKLLVKLTVPSAFLQRLSCRPSRVGGQTGVEADEDAHTPPGSSTGDVPAGLQPDSDAATSQNDNVPASQHEDALASKHGNAPAIQHYDAPASQDDDIHTSQDDEAPTVQHDDAPANQDDGSPNHHAADADGDIGMTDTTNDED